MAADREYEAAPGPAPWKLPLAIAIVALIAVAAVVRIGRAEPPEPIAQLARPGPGAPPPPATLADGQPPAEVPEAIDARFEAPVIATRRLVELPPAVLDRCRTAHFADAARGSPRAFRHEQLQQLVDAARLAGAWVGPDALMFLTIGDAPSPPGFPNRYQVSCAAVSGQSGWRPTIPLIDFAANNYPGWSAGALLPDLYTRLIDVPRGARWALQEQPGWWLAHDVAGSGWLIAPLPPDATERPRVVFLSESGELVDDRRLGASPARPRARQHGTDGDLVVGPVDEVLARLNDAPLQRCTQAQDPSSPAPTSPEAAADQICVWITKPGSDIVALAAFGPDNRDVPPFGFVGYCPQSATLAGAYTGSHFMLDGTWMYGAAPRSLGSYRVHYEGPPGERMVVVDLSTWQPGPPRGDPTARAEGRCALRGDPVAGSSG